MSNLKCPTCGEQIYYVEEALNYWEFDVKDLADGELTLTDLSDSRTNDNELVFMCSKGHETSYKDVIDLAKGA